MNTHETCTAVIFMDKRYVTRLLYLPIFDLYLKKTPLCEYKLSNPNTLSKNIEWFPVHHIQENFFFAPHILKFPSYQNETSTTQVLYKSIYDSTNH